MSKNIDEQFVEYIVKSLVGNPDAVEIKRTIDEKGVLLELTVDPEDLGRVIGKRGATAQSLRTLLRALGTKNDARYNLKIVDNGEPRPDREERAPREERDDRREEQPDASDEDVAPAEDEDEVASTVTDDVNDDDDDEDDDDRESDSVSKTRKELADLDDLDI